MNDKEKLALPDTISRGKAHQYRLVICILSFQLFALSCIAQYTKLLDFAGIANGSYPNGSLIYDGTYLYGMTFSGGSMGSGLIFKIKPDGSGFINLFDFDGASQGSYPKGSLISDGTFLYGMTSQGGLNDFGVVFKIKLDGTGYTKLLDFDGSNNGNTPNSSLSFDGTFLYGTTTQGGNPGGYGTLFKIMPDGTGYFKILDFDGTTTGYRPSGSLIFDGTFLYGMATYDGISGFGTVFKIKPDGSGYATLLDFDYTNNGGNPSGDLIYDGVFLYGVTSSGGLTSNGTIFKIKPDGTSYTKLLDFDGASNGSLPNGSMIINGAFLYGMTSEGGLLGSGTMYKIKQDGTGYAKLLDFNDGRNPQGSLFSDGTYLYGLAKDGGANSLGILFKRSLAPATSITNFIETEGVEGAYVTINGVDFDPTPTNNIVTFNGTNAVVTSATPTSLVAIVPVGATTGPISVTAYGTSISTSNFNVTADAIMVNGMVQNCSVVFLPPTYSYTNSHGDKAVETFLPTSASDKVKISFSSFLVTGDVLNVYDGPSVASPLITTLSGSTLPADIIATGPGGELTFEYLWQDGSTNWDASISCLAGTSCIPSSERAALIALYNSTNGVSWTNSNNWLNGDESTWFGISLNGCSVYKIKLENNNLSGLLPPEIGDLPDLTHLFLKDNKISGTLPAELGNLSNMDFFDLANNNLSGSIPNEIGGLNNLFYMDISKNQLSGSIPIELGNLSSLGYLRLENNQLTGTIPSELGNIASLESLGLQNNLLTGSIPTSLGNLPNLSFLELDWNQLTGTIPTELGNDTNLAFMRLSSNQLTGSIPSSFGNLTKLFLLDLNTNQLTDSIPTEFGNLVLLRYLNLYENQLSGPIPSEFGNLAELEGLDIFTNQLSGNLPKELSNCTKLTGLEVGNNLLSGSYPPEYASLINLEIFQADYNNFTGSVPIEYLAWPKIQLILISHNQLDGLPTFTASTITNLAVENNNLDFGDLELNIGTTGYTYIPQAKLPPGGTLSVNENSPIAIPFSTSGSANSYQWFKDGSPVSGATSATFTKAGSTPADAGTYYVEVTNSIVTGLTLQSDDYFVTINAAPVILTILITLPIQGVTTIDLIPLITTSGSPLDISSLQVTVAPSSGASASIDGNGILTLDYAGINFSGTETLSIRACDLSGNCTTQQFEVEVIGDIIIYTGISPNADGLNDTWVIKYIDALKDTKENKVSIYNRWGDLIFEATNYDNDTRVFKGINKSGNEVITGVYFYKIEFMSGHKTKTGYLTVKK